MTSLRAYIEGVGVVGPGLTNWSHAADVLAQRSALDVARTVLPAPASLPSAERRRTGPVVRAALAAAHEAVAQSARDAATLAAVFAASGGDGGNFHAICETLASDDPQLSPTRFHNSVHNAPAGYWSIATRAMAASNVLCAYDGSFAAGLLESLAQVSVDGTATLLVAYDTDYPEPLRRVRPITDAFGVALVLAPQENERTLARIEARLSDANAFTFADAALEALRLSNPAARALPLLDALARGVASNVVLDYLDGTQLAVDIAPS
ncbi:3-oxoacyl-ACP synthase [Caballeronia fortuita]|uniref:3-oxoacyl-ACP synthase n=1 Tax=Caballeronia fortuita TaxID=1777138 RepID=A0A157ZQU4_9BURK|nr:beta-ketoacyl synthase chain length factor [Caballeronia fortuita]SAK47856.1 3-oxoacyl-ACP synthase [Caballeronia fortuita]